MEPVYSQLGYVCFCLIVVIGVIGITIATLMAVEYLWCWLWRALTVALPGMWRARFRRKYGKFDSLSFMYQPTMDKQAWALVNEEFYRGMYQGVWLCFWLAGLVALYFTFCY